MNRVLKKLIYIVLAGCVAEKINQYKTIIERDSFFYCYRVFLMDFAYCIKW